jgi:hypothetical protein
MGYTINDTDSRYNGWTNYATWRVNLEMFDDINALDMWPREVCTDDAYSLGKQLEEYADEVVTGELPEGLAADYARAFMADVNWQEIAEHLLDAIKQEAA